MEEVQGTELEDSYPTSVGAWLVNPFILHASKENHVGYADNHFKITWLVLKVYISVSKV